METINSSSSGLEPLLSIEELAEYLEVPVTTIRDWRTDGKGKRWVSGRG
jgi:excisionase family DNA binding protein